MPFVVLPTNSFSQGEIGYYLAGRSDLDIYRQSAQKIENAIVLPQGGVQRRPGTRYIDTIPATYADDILLTKFDFQKTEQYLLVFYHGKLKIYYQNKVVATIDTPYSRSRNIRLLRFAQSGDTLIIVHPEYMPRSLNRLGSNTDWSFGILAFQNKPYIRFDYTSGLKPSGASGTIELNITNGGSWYWTETNNRRIKLNNGEVQLISTPVNSTTVSAAVIDTLETIATARSWSEEAWSEARGFPRSVAFHESRLVFGGTRDRPSIVMASKTGDYFNFDDTDTLDDNTWKFDISTTKVHAIRNLYSLEHLHVFTTDGEFTMRGTDDASISPTNIKVASQSEYGSNACNIETVEGEVLFAPSTNKEIRGYEYRFETDKFESESKTVVSNHLFSPEAAPKSMAYMPAFKDTQANLLIVVRSDGQIAALTYDNLRDVKGWTRWTTDGKFLDCEVVTYEIAPEVETESLYLATQRKNGFFIEQLSLKDQENDLWYLDNYTVYGSANSAIELSQLTGLDIYVSAPTQFIVDGALEHEIELKSNEVDLPVTGRMAVLGHNFKTEVEQNQFVVALGNQLKRAKRLQLKKAICQFWNTGQAIVNDRYISFEPEGTLVTDTTVSGNTGQYEVSIKGSYKDQELRIECNEPVPFTLLSVATKARIDGKD